LQASDGHLLWLSSPGQKPVLSLEVANGIVSIVLDGHVIALRASEGKVFWQSRQGLQYLSLLVADGILSASEDEGSLASPMTGLVRTGHHLL